MLFFRGKTTCHHWQDIKDATNVARWPGRFFMQHELVRLGEEGQRNGDDDGRCAPHFVTETLTICRVHRRTRQLVNGSHYNLNGNPVRVWVETTWGSFQASVRRSSTSPLSHHLAGRRNTSPATIMLTRQCSTTSPRDSHAASILSRHSLGHSIS